jgi:hypothetical protein
MFSLYNIEYSEVDVQWSGSTDPLYLQHLEDRRLGGPHSRSGICREENLFEPRFLGRPAQNQFVYRLSSPGCLIIQKESNLCITIVEAKLKKVS